jgi:hypothetical protein
MSPGTMNQLPLDSLGEFDDKILGGINLTDTNLSELLYQLEKHGLPTSDQKHILIARLALAAAHWTGENAQEIKNCETMVAQWTKLTKPSLQEEFLLAGISALTLSAVKDDLIKILIHAKKQSIEIKIKKEKDSGAPIGAYAQFAGNNFKSRYYRSIIPVQNRLTS